MDNLENLYNVIKTFLPIANQYLSNSPIEPYIPQIQNIVDTIDSFGGISVINSLMNSFKAQNNISTQTNLSINNNTTQSSNKKNIDSYKRV